MATGGGLHPVPGQNCNRTIQTAETASADAFRAEMQLSTNTLDSTHLNRWC